MQLKIAIGGLLGSGKDTAVDYLINKYGGIKITFADPLYDILHHAQNVCGFPQEKDREFLQWIGTEWGRKKEEQIWVRLAMEKANTVQGNVFISDVRFPNEFQAAKDNGFKCIKILRNNVDNGRVGSGSSTHSSETSLNDVQNWDSVISNDTSFDDLYKMLDHTLRLWYITGEI
jgi:hypothetical protein